MARVQTAELSALHAPAKISHSPQDLILHTTQKSCVAAGDIELNQLQVVPTVLELQVKIPV